METKQRSLVHSILMRKRTGKDSKWKGLDRFAVEQLIRMLAFGFPLAVLALLGNATLEDFRAKQREFERRQQAWSTLHYQLSETYGEFRRTLFDSNMLYAEYRKFSEDIDKARRNGTPEDVLEGLVAENDFERRTDDTMASLFDSFYKLFDIVQTSMLYSEAHDRRYFQDYAGIFLAWATRSLDNHSLMLASIGRDHLADATIYYEQSKSDKESGNFYSSVSLMMLDHNLQPTYEEYEVIKKLAKDAEASIQAITPSLKRKTP